MLIRNKNNDIYNCCKNCKKKIGIGILAMNKVTKQTRIKHYHNKLQNRHYMQRYMRHYRKRILKHLQETVWQLIAYQLDYKVKVPYHWEHITGWNVIQLAGHLQSLWKPEMTWKNYGCKKHKLDKKQHWQLDHIRPRTNFKFKTYTDAEFKKLWQLNNIQPLWENENKMKFTKNFKEWEEYKKQMQIQTEKE